MNSINPSNRGAAGNEGVSGTGGNNRNVEEEGGRRKLSISSDTSTESRTESSGSLQRQGSSSGSSLDSLDVQDEGYDGGEESSDSSHVSSSNVGITKIKKRRVSTGRGLGGLNSSLPKSSSSESLKSSSSLLTQPETKGGKTKNKRGRLSKLAAKLGKGHGILSGSSNSESLGSSSSSSQPKTKGAARSTFFYNLDGTPKKLSQEERLAEALELKSEIYDKMITNAAAIMKHGHAKPSSNKEEVQSSSKSEEKSPSFFDSKGQVRVTAANKEALLKMLEERSEKDYYTRRYADVNLYDEGRFEEKLAEVRKEGGTSSDSKE